GSYNVPLGCGFSGFQSTVGTVGPSEPSEPKCARSSRRNEMAAARTSIVLACAAVAVFATADVRMAADQPAPIPPVNDAPNPYNTIKDFFKLPNGRQGGSTRAVDVDKDGKSI